MEGGGIRRRSSRLSGMFDAASKAVAQLIQRDNDPEEDPDFIARNPRWEDRLPPIGGALKPEEEKTAALLAALGDLPRATDSLPRKNWKKAYKAVKRMLVVRRKARRSAIGTGARLDGHALGFWSPYSTTRLRLFMFLYSQKVEYFILFLIWAHLIVFIFQVKIGNRSERWTDIRNFKLDFLDGLITALSTLEVILKVFVLGLYKKRHCYLRNPYNRLDFAMVIDSWLSWRR
ncbi:uncharacterized protein LOC112341586 [Selaginella moellendorffii]|uniref:uncharacterized protein LOC112341586 n=1 Tax=Selaginella moellendorffii TaxID=88036 RepID=UPI000D1C9D37|nr:uncharacterized protein LOC112341586 [Selaginella moellendorffii]|eukprot:XP_024517727.1 uncharacterized protein LOC112341586 [Selaginella moellendorffii]